MSKFSPYCTVFLPLSPVVCSPNLDGSFKINEGLRVGRKVLLDITTIGIYHLRALCTPAAIFRLLPHRASDSRGVPRYYHTAVHW